MKGININYDEIIEYVSVYKYSTRNALLALVDKCKYKLWALGMNRDTIPSLYEYTTSIYKDDISTYIAFLDKIEPNRKHDTVTYKDAADNICILSLEKDSDKMKISTVDISDPIMVSNRYATSIMSTAIRDGLLDVILSRVKDYINE